MAPEHDPDAPVVPVAARGRRKEKGAFFRTLATPAAPLFDLMATIDIVDGHKLPAHGSFVVTPNHYTNIDPVVVGRVLWALGRVPRFLAKASLFRVPVFGRMMHAMGHIPVERAGRTHDNDPLAAGRALAATGGGVIVYPEGTLTRDPDLWPMKGKSGAVRLALAADVPLIPMAHWGSQQLMGRYSSKLRPFPRKRITVVIGDPVDLSAYRGRALDQASITAATALVMQSITELVERLRGEEAPAERWNPAANDQKETGRFE
ncbi:lysophospholipid acyltransferase family protein [Frigoribacterium faeni]|uniref:1-acyl-sn-glycerol-3-phosphate acyltransferase n=1 Tax=Frigoribacterium faeni TaxID=145483 RepID=A0A7W3JGF5_9MICO|nr:lysophospholipid acyltransferase family protein [Frigoribacterium faeni]MBA8812375.1 1-acyl-sn-glycerol-3-phosphate acyltransferase [Frigoribacterium faeni]BFF13440.1 lysophospholipid acyltransferase family protein [Microbacterium flavescens]GEK81912.1 1-acyl-sn-glycerol-3-phosphate acyltransferase [Frigoribacterium faeni]